MRVNGCKSDVLIYSAAPRAEFPVLPSRARWSLLSFDALGIADMGRKGNPGE